MEVDETIAHSGKKSLKIIGITATGIPWHSKVRYELLPTVKDETLTVAFWAKVDAEQGKWRDVQISAQLENEPWPGFYNWTIQLDSTEWKEYKHTFAVTEDKGDNIWIALSVAQSDVDFWIDDFRLFEGGPEDEIIVDETPVNPDGKVPKSWGDIKNRTDGVGLLINWIMDAYSSISPLIKLYRLSPTNEIYHTIIVAGLIRGYY